MPRKTPQEKKALSYAKDRRNSYGESDKGPRKIIPLRKRLVNRGNRRDEQIALSSAVGAMDPSLAEDAEQRMLSKRPRTWRKSPDSPLKEVVERARARRAALQDSPRKNDEARARRRK